MTEMYKERQIFGSFYYRFNNGESGCDVYVGQHRSCHDCKRKWLWSPRHPFAALRATALTTSFACCSSSINTITLSFDSYDRLDAFIEYLFRCFERPRWPAAGLQHKREKKKKKKKKKDDEEDEEEEEEGKMMMMVMMMIMMMIMIAITCTSVLIL